MVVMTAIEMMLATLGALAGVARRVGAATEHEATLLRNADPNSNLLAL